MIEDYTSKYLNGDISLEKARLFIFAENYNLDKNLAEDLMHYYSVKQIKEILIIPDFYDRFEMYITPDYSPQIIGFIRDAVYFDFDPEVLNVKKVRSDEVGTLRKGLHIPNLYDLFIKDKENIEIEDEDYFDRSTDVYIEREGTENETLNFVDDESFFDFLEGNEEINLDIFFDELEEEIEMNDEEFYMTESKLTYKDYVKNELFRNAILINRNDEISLFNNIDISENYDRIFNANIRLAVYFAKRYKHIDSNYYPDYVQQGFLGVLNAMERFDPERGFRFSTLAVSHIRQQIWRFIQDTISTIRIPVHKREELSVLEKYLADYFLSGFDYPDFEKISKSLNMDLNAVKKDIRLLNQSKLLSCIDKSEEEQIELRYQHNSTEVQIRKAFLEKSLREILPEHLNNRELVVIEKRFGINKNQRVHTLEEIGLEIGVTRERIRQIEAKAIRKLKSKGSFRQLYREFLND